ncbi:MAG: sigma-70 family RNA polymerase sigma factor [Acidobacteria bacterium]|nr:sigma-70 family RNA polymerase sigma factor [Acidobacteriota bacterium]
MNPEPWPPTVASVKAAQNGDPTALEAVYRTMQPRLAAFLRYQGFSQTVQEDIAADVSETVLTKISTLRNSGTFEAWFWAITRNQIRAWLRAKRRDAQKNEPAEPEPATLDEIVIAKEEHSDIRLALSHLSDQDRHLLWMREIEGLSYKNIGTIVGVAPGTVRVRCHRARRKLEVAYEDLRQEHPSGATPDS